MNRLISFLVLFSTQCVTYFNIFSYDAYPPQNRATALYITPKLRVLCWTSDIGAPAVGQNFNVFTHDAVHYHFPNAEGMLYISRQIHRFKKLYTQTLNLLSITKSTHPDFKTDPH